MSVTKEQIPELSQAILGEVGKAIVGKQELLEMFLTTVLADGHILLEDFPGLGKTLLARSFAQVLGLDFKRIQFTPDLLPGEITGGYVFDRNKSAFTLRKGPVFANVVLADEINRASPKTQSALLEAMQERQVSLEGTTMSLPKPFLVLATQNPIEYEGTFPLPEAQLDRFMVKLKVGYPSEADEREILIRRRERKTDDVDLQQITDAETLLEMRALVEEIHIHSDLETYIVRLVQRTREDHRVAVGASPRASLAFLKLARVRALLNQRDYVIPDDIKHFAVPVLSHRLILEPAHWMSPRVAGAVIRDIFTRVSVPVID